MDRLPLDTVLDTVLDTLAVDAARLAELIDALARLSDAPPPAVTRVLYSARDLEARAFLKGLCAERGLELREDALGNLFARWLGEDPTLAIVATGSHIDAIPHSGRFDGTVGVLGGLEAIRALEEAGVRPRRSIELIVFTAEEPTRFGIGCLGSRAMAGALTPEALVALRDEVGRPLDEVRREAGFDGPLAGVRVAADAYHAFVELHIEQGAILEREGVDIGVVEAIAAPATLHLALEGQGGHAGAVLMSERHDALPAAAEIVLAAERAARTTGSGDSVATVGILDVHPRAVNSIPSRVVLTVDARDTELSRRDRMIDEVRAAAERVAAERGVTLQLEVVNADPPAACAPQVQAATRAACEREGLRHRTLVSRAYHDALFMAQLCPTGMVFIPCRGGVSHRPDEYASPGHIAAGVRVLARTLAALAMS